MEKITENKVKKVLEKQSTCAFVPKGVSMWPFIKNRKSTVIVKSPDEEINPYDVIFYETLGGREVLHRVIGKVGEDFITMGDGLLECEQVKKEDVFGVMKGYYVGKKYIDAKDPKYLEKVRAYYGKPKKRRRRIKRYRLRLKIKNKIKLLLKRGKNKNV